MGEVQHEQLCHLLDFQFENHRLHPVEQGRLDALNGWIGGRVRQLLSMPVADEAELRSGLRHELATVKDVIPAFELGKIFALRGI